MHIVYIIKENVFAHLTNEETFIKGSKIISDQTANLIQEYS